jgi:hypothetical protein
LASPARPPPLPEPLPQPKPEKTLTPSRRVITEIAKPIQSPISPSVYQDVPFVGNPSEARHRSGLLHLVSHTGKPEQPLLPLPRVSHSCNESNF